MHQKQREQSMKKTLVMTTLMTALMVMPMARGATLDYKKEGAICDRKAGFCADSEGVSVALTKMYLGDKAQAKLMAQINAVGLESFDASTFTMSGGLTCKTKEKTCWTSRIANKVDAKATKVLFGN